MNSAIGSTTMADSVPAIYFDEDAAYKQEYPKNPNSKVGTETVDLYEKVDEESSGTVKAYYRGDGSGPLLYSKQNSRYSISVQRLLWVDGYHGIAREGTDEQSTDELTLIVLKLIFAPSGKKTKVDYAITQLVLQSGDQEGKDPEVIAWGPLHHGQKWNESTVQKSFKVTSDLKGGVNLSGPELSAGVGSESESQWEQKNFETGSSHPLFSMTKGTRHGVLWKVEQNRHLNEGITAEMCIGVLARRQEPKEPYLVTLTVDACTSTMSDWRSAGYRFFGREPGESVVWKALPEPGHKSRCHEEGVHIAQSIDPNKLGSLIDEFNSTNLDHDWLKPPSQIQNVSESRARLQTKSADSAGPSPMPASMAVPESDLPYNQQSPIHGAAGVPNTAGDETLGGGTAPEPEAPIGPDTGRSMFISTSVPQYSGNSMNDRLVSLEARTAQLEARLVSQDQIILRLQQRLLGGGQFIPA